MRRMKLSSTGCDYRMVGWQRRARYNWGAWVNAYLFKKNKSSFKNSKASLSFYAGMGWIIWQKLASWGAVQAPNVYSGMVFITGHPNTSTCVFMWYRHRCFYLALALLHDIVMDNLCVMQHAWHWHKWFFFTRYQYTQAFERKTSHMRDRY